MVDMMSKPRRLSGDKIPLRRHDDNETPLETSSANCPKTSAKQPLDRLSTPAESIAEMQPISYYTVAVTAGIFSPFFRGFRYYYC